jgi:membrane protein implicated in regulation of membrane protease activity
LEATLDWNAWTFWWVACGVLVAAELATGTFYLLMLALGCAAAALAAHLGAGATVQMVVAALVGGGATAAWHLNRRNHPKAEPAERNRDVNLDIGESVQVTQWNSDGSTRVQYRGAAWSARLAERGTAEPGPHTIVAVHGNELRVTPSGAR